MTKPSDINDEDILNIEDEDVELLEDGSDEELEEFYSETLDVEKRLQEAADNIPPQSTSTKYVSELKLALDKEKMEMMRLMMLDILDLLVEIRDNVLEE